MQYVKLGFCVMLAMALVSTGASAGKGGGGGAPSSAAASTAPNAGGGQQPPPASNPGGSGMTPAAAMPSAPPMFFRRRTLFVLALAGDPATSAKLSVETARFIMATQALKGGAWAISAPGWGITEFVAQCQARPESTLGALIYYNAVQENASNNFLLIARGTTQVDADAMFAECIDPKLNPGPPIAITWTGNDAVGLGSRNSFSFLPLAAIATAVSAFNSAHSVSSTSQTTYTGPTPRPDGALTATQVVTTTASTKNASDATTLLAAAALTQLGAANTNVPGNNGDPQLKSAVQHLASDMLRLFRKSCNDSEERQFNNACAWFVQSRLPEDRKATNLDPRSKPLFGPPILPIAAQTPLPTPGPDDTGTPYPCNPIPSPTPSPTPDADASSPTPTARQSSKPTSQHLNGTESLLSAPQPSPTPPDSCRLATASPSPHSAAPSARPTPAPGFRR